MPIILGRFIEHIKLPTTVNSNISTLILVFFLECRNETKELKSNLASYGMKKSEAEGLYAQAQENAAK